MTAYGVESGLILSTQHDRRVTFAVVKFARTPQSVEDQRKKFDISLKREVARMIDEQVSSVLNFSTAC
jgi:hypothetical protein